MKKYIFPLFLSLSLFSQESENKVENETVEEVVVIGTKASLVKLILVEEAQRCLFAYIAELQISSFVPL